MVVALAAAAAVDVFVVRVTSHLAPLHRSHPPRFRTAWLAWYAVPVCGRMRVFMCMLACVCRHRDGPCAGGRGHQVQHDPAVLLRPGGGLCRGGRHPHQPLRGTHSGLVSVLDAWLFHDFAQALGAP